MKIIINNKEEIEILRKSTITEIVAKTTQSLPVIAAKVDGELADLSRELIDRERPYQLELITIADDAGKMILRHSTGHLMTQAVLRLYGPMNLGVGPAIDNGFYQDFQTDKITPDEFRKIEEEMNRLLAENIPFVRQEISKQEALEIFGADPFKRELIEAFPDTEVISIYKQAERVDLCSGPHIPDSSYVQPGSFKLTKIGGAYWRGDQAREQLTRIYGVVFSSKAELDAYTKQQEEAILRDHRRIGPEMELFHFSEFSPGIPFFLPKGTKVYNDLVALKREKMEEYGYVEVRTPIILKPDLWKTSGHWNHYQENMYLAHRGGKSDEAGEHEQFGLKPMNCPGACIIFGSRTRSYRELPMRLGEFGYVHRFEDSGALSGLLRVRAFTQDDAHLFVSLAELPSEITRTVQMYTEIYRIFGFDVDVVISTRPEVRMGDDSDWDLAETSLVDAVENSGLPYAINAGDGAFYGPKIDFRIHDVSGRQWQCGTIQADFQLPIRFDLAFSGADGKLHRPVMIHPAAFGSLERFLAILIEQFEGKFPSWLAPQQAVIIPVDESHFQYAEEVRREMSKAGLVGEIDFSPEMLSTKIKNSKRFRAPYRIVVGDRERVSRTVAVRDRKNKTATIPLADFIRKIAAEVGCRRMCSHTAEELQS